MTSSRSHAATSASITPPGLAASCTGYGRLPPGPSPMPSNNLLSNRCPWFLSHFEMNLRRHPASHVTAPRTYGLHLQVPDERPRLRAPRRPAQDSPGYVDVASVGEEHRRRWPTSSSSTPHAQRVRPRQQALRQPRQAGQPGNDPWPADAVSGCRLLAEWETIVQRLHGVDVVFGTHNIGKPPCSTRPRATGVPRARSGIPRKPSACQAGRLRDFAGWVSISVGNNNTCTFCYIVHSLRGTEQDLPTSRKVDTRNEGVVESGPAGPNTYLRSDSLTISPPTSCCACGDARGLDMPFLDPPALP